MTLEGILLGIIAFVVVFALLEWSERAYRRPTFRHDTYATTVNARVGEQPLRLKHWLVAGAGAPVLRVFWRVTRNQDAELLEVELRIDARTHRAISTWQLEVVLQEGYRFADQESREPHVIMTQADQVEENGDHVWKWQTLQGTEYLAQREGSNRWA
jgi:hypothetical protein